jgi:hypothetical protein
MSRLRLERSSGLALEPSGADRFQLAFRFSRRSRGGSLSRRPFVAHGENSLPRVVTLEQRQLQQNV